jgi:hypothetical protein
LKRRVALEGEDLDRFLKEEQARIEQEELDRALAEHRRKALERDDGDDSEEEEEGELRLLVGGYDAYLKEERQGVLRPGLNNASSTPGVFRMFPSNEKRFKMDVYGEVIRKEDFEKKEDGTKEKEPGGSKGSRSRRSSAGVSISHSSSFFYLNYLLNSLRGFVLYFFVLSVYVSLLSLKRMRWILIKLFQMTKRIRSLARDGYHSGVWTRKYLCD